MCKDCARLLSPFTTNRHQTSLSEIKEHLEYREANKVDVEGFVVEPYLKDATEKSAR